MLNNKISEVKNYEFYDEATGEVFFVMARELSRAKRIASCFFDEPRFTHNVYDDYEAEMLGYDTY